MSPGLPTARPAWVWSISTFAVILSLLWYRKKRGSLKTDSGGSGETQNCPKSVNSDNTIKASLNSEEKVKIRNSKSVEESSVDSKKEVIENWEKEVEEDWDKEVVEDWDKKVVEDWDKEVVEDWDKKVVEDWDKEVVEDWDKEVVEDLKKEVIEVVEQVKSNRKVEAIIKSVEDTEAMVAAVADTNKSEEKVEKKEINTEKEKVGESTSVKSKCGKKKKFKDMAKKSKDSNSGQRQNKEENTACILEQKLAKLDLSKQCSSSNGSDEKQTNEDVAERDSANNSPSEVMLASPSVSAYSDTHSEGSSDSGKGCSEMLTPTRTPASGNSVSGDLPPTSIYEFVIPQQLVGRLIGRHGSYVNEIKETTHASIYIKKHPETSKLKICAVEGTQMDIESALEMIRRKFPKKRYPGVTLEQVVIASEPQMIPIIPENMQLYLIEGINNDVILSSLVSAGHFFLQQPTHPTFPSLNRLNLYMMYCYSEPDQPTLPEGVGAGILCAAPVHNGWYRAQITNMDAENNLCDVKFVDYGGYMTLPVSMLRQIRVDFVNLPFQAAECYLAGVKPANEENIWSEKAKELVEKLTYGKVLQAQVYGYAEDTVPLIYLYTVVNDEVVLINQELVNHGFAEWLYAEPVTEEVEDAGGSEMEENRSIAVAV